MTQPPVLPEFERVPVILTSSFRRLRQQPVFALTVVATLALGIGTTTAIFSVVNAALVRPLPYPRPDELFAVSTRLTNGKYTSGKVAPVEIAGLGAPGSAIERAALVLRSDGTLLRRDAPPIPVVMYGVSEGFFDVIGLPMASGRSFEPREHQRGTNPVVIISYRLWRDAFGLDPQMLGQPLRLAAGTLEVVGVARPEMNVPPDADLWFSAVMAPQSTAHSYDGYLRVEPGTSPERLRDDLDTTMSRLAADYPTSDASREFVARPLLEVLVGDLRTVLLLVFAGALVLMALACVTASSMLLVRNVARARDIAIRRSLGATLRHVAAERAAETVMLCGAAMVAGFVLARWSVRALFGWSGASVPRLDDVPIDSNVLIAAVLAVLICAALVVAVQVAVEFRTDSLAARSRERAGTPARSVLASHRWLGTIEIALAVVLVSTVGQLTHALSRLNAIDPGFSPDALLVFDALLPGSRYGNAERVEGWFEEVRTRLVQTGKVAGVASTSAFPFKMDSDQVYYIEIAGSTAAPGEENTARLHRVTRDFFDVVGARMIAGGWQGDGGARDLASTVVNQTFADRYLGGGDPIGQHVFYGFPAVNRQAPFEVVGVVQDLKYSSLAEPPAPAFYLLPGRLPFLQQRVTIRAAGDDPHPLVPVVRELASEVDSAIPIDVEVASDLVWTSLGHQRLGLILIMSFAVVAILIAAVGTYGAAVFMVAERQGEVALRIALGAERRSILRLIVARSARLWLTGIVLGGLLAYVSGRLLAGWVFAVRPADPVAVGGAMVVLALVALGAVVVPSLNASRVDPAAMLRLEI